MDLKHFNIENKYHRKEFRRVCHNGFYIWSQYNWNVTENLSLNEVGETQISFWSNASLKSSQLNDFLSCLRHLGAKGWPSRRPSMLGIEGRREGRPLAPKRGAREEGEDEGFFKNKFSMIWIGGFSEHQHLDNGIS